MFADSVRRVLLARGLRAFADGYASILLPVYMLQIGLQPLQIGTIASAMLLGPAAILLLLSLNGHRFRVRSLLLLASTMMIVTGLGFAGATDYLPFLLVGLFGTLHPSGGDANLFRPLDQSALANVVTEDRRVDVYARYSIAGALCGSLGALASGAVDWFLPILPANVTTQAMFVLYAALGVANIMLYRSMPKVTQEGVARSAPLKESRGRVLRLAALFSVDAFGSGFVVNSIIVLWLVHRFDVSVATVSLMYFIAGLGSAIAQLTVAPLARRLGLISAIVATHAPGNACLILAAFAPNMMVAGSLLVLRAVIGQLDVAARASYVMSVVTSAERIAAAFVTALPFSLAAVASPALAGLSLSWSDFGWPLVIGGSVKILYDVLLLLKFR